MLEKSRMKNNVLIFTSAPFYKLEKKNSETNTFVLPSPNNIVSKNQYKCSYICYWRIILRHHIQDFSADDFGFISLIVIQ